MSLRKNVPGQTDVKEVDPKVSAEISKDGKVVATKEEPVVEEPIVTTEDEAALEKLINAKRDEYKKYADKQKKLNLGITIGVCILLVACFVVILTLGSYGDWILYVCMGVMVLVLIGTYISSRYMRKNLMAKAEVYIDYLYQETSKYIYSDKDIKDLTSTSKGTLEDKWFLDAHFYNNIKGTKSRNYSHFNYKGAEYDTCDLAGNTTVKGKLSPKFLGRFYSVKANVKTNEKVTIFQLKGGKLSIPLDDIEDLKLVEGNDTYAIYTNDDKYKNIFTSKLIKELTGFQVKDPLIDVIFSVKDNLISLGIDYNDDFLNIPVDHDFSVKYTRKSKEDFARVSKIISTVIENYNNKNTEKTK